MYKIEAEVTDGHLAIRTDRHIHADVGLKQEFVGLLLNYNPVWLRIGLEQV